MLPSPYDQIHDEFLGFLPKERIHISPLENLAYGTDASFYRLVPKIVVDTESEDEVRKILGVVARYHAPVTFRAAGTSLSGQSVSDSVLVRLGRGWRNHSILDKGGRIALEPGIIGSHANRILAPFGKKIGPDPASIDACKIGGIVANNASGMCCGVAENSYKTLDSLRLVLVDGTVLDTGDQASREAFRKTHGNMLESLADLRGRVLENQDLADRIRRKFKIKNTMGYSLNALVDFEDPFDILQHLLVGSEGTLAFISRVVYRTVVEHPHKATALMRFPDIKSACLSATTLKAHGVSAAELMDRAAIASVEHQEGMPEGLAQLGPEAAALLVELRGPDRETLDSAIDEALEAIAHIPCVSPHKFTHDPDEYKSMWNVRKGLFPAVGAVRQAGTTVIIEDVCFPIDKLAEGALELQGILRKHGYDKAILFGHALEGNLHFVFTQGFSEQSEIDRYAAMMNDVSDMVAGRFQGSLKAEHGTGRNMAPFVEMEWGREAYQLMREIKNLFDPMGLLNPGVLLNEDSQAHLKNLKPLPVADDLIDMCIECGYCEETCPSKDLTLTPRQRIVAFREISRLRQEGGDKDLLKSVKKIYDYDGEATCAADGLCAMRCPVDIDTGKFIKHYRSQHRGWVTKAVASTAASAFTLTGGAIDLALKTAGLAHDTLGDTVMDAVCGGLHKYSGRAVPRWNVAMPRTVGRSKRHDTPASDRKVVYFPSCVSRHMGADKRDPDKSTLQDHVLSLLAKAGYEVIFPQRMDRLCCGQPWESKGFMKQADAKLRELEYALRQSSEDGKYPILCDTSPCLMRMKTHITSLVLHEPVEFTRRYLFEHLEFIPVNRRVALHVTCSSRKMGLAEKMEHLVRTCAREVVVPKDVYCCGFAGDRGFNHPELNTSALHNLRGQVDHCDVGYSTSRTCEIGLSLHGGLPYKNLLVLLDEASWPREE